MGSHLCNRETNRPHEEININSPCFFLYCQIDNPFQFKRARCRQSKIYRSSFSQIDTANDKGKKKITGKKSRKNQDRRKQKKKPGRKISNKKRNKSDSKKSKKKSRKRKNEGKVNGHAKKRKNKGKGRARKRKNKE